MSQATPAFAARHAPAFLVTNCPDLLRLLCCPCIWACRSFQEGNFTNAFQLVGTHLLCLLTKHAEANGESLGESLTGLRAAAYCGGLLDLPASQSSVSHRSPL